MASVSEDTLFKQLLNLVGSEVEVSLESLRQPFRGKVTNAMFDSFVLEVGGISKVIAFRDIFYLRRLA